MDETTVAPPAYDENDIITHIFCLDRCFARVQKTMSVVALGGALKSWAAGLKEPTVTVQVVKPPIFSLFCSAAQQISFV